MKNIAPTTTSSDNQTLLFNLLQALETIGSFNGNTNPSSFAKIFFKVIPKEGQNAVIWNQTRFLKILTAGAVQVVELLEKAEKQIKEKNLAPECSKKNAMTLTKIAEGLNAKLSIILQVQQAQKNLQQGTPVMAKKNSSLENGQKTLTKRQENSSFLTQRSFQKNAFAKNLMEPVRLAIQTLSSAKHLTPSDAITILNKLEKTTLLIDRMIRPDSEQVTRKRGKDCSFQQALRFSKNPAFKQQSSQKLPQAEKIQAPLASKNRTFSLERRERLSNFHPSQGIFQDPKENGKKSKETEKHKGEQIFKVSKAEELLYLKNKKPSDFNLPASAQQSNVSASTEKVLTLEPKNLLAAPYTAEKKRDKNPPFSKKKPKRRYFFKSEDDSSQDTNHPSS